MGKLRGRVEVISAAFDAVWTQAAAQKVEVKLPVTAEVKPPVTAADKTSVVDTRQ